MVSEPHEFVVITLISCVMEAVTCFFSINNKRFENSTCTNKMFFKCISLTCLVAVVAFANGYVRVVRSPDSMEVEVPNYTTESNQDRMDEEGEYWQGERDKYNDRYQEDRENRNKTAQQDQEDLDNEREYSKEQQQNFNNDMEDDYNKNQDRLEDQEGKQKDHYDSEHQNDNDYNSQGDKANGDFNDEVGAKGDRYEEKGEQDMNDREDKMENYDAREQSPSMTYNRD